MTSSATKPKTAKPKAAPKPKTPVPGSYQLKNPDARVVEVVSQRRPLSYINMMGQEKPLGTLKQEVYGEDNLVRLYLHPDSNNPWARKKELQSEAGYYLGDGAGTIDIVNPADAQRWLIESGWKMKDLISTSGGTVLTAVFIDPESRIADPIVWDRDFWGVGDRMTEMYNAVILNVNLFVGRMAATFQQSIYRLVCSNGMTGTVLGLPGVSVRHGEWGEWFVDQRFEDVGFAGFTEAPQGPVIGTGNSFLQIQKFLTELIEARTTKAPKSDRVKFIEETFPTFGERLTSTWTLQGVLNQFKLMTTELGPTDEVRSLDVLNAYTSAVNLKRSASSDRGIWSALSIADRFVNDSITFSKLATIFSEN